MNIDKYLYEIIEDYKEADSEEEKSEVFNDFCSSLWSSKNKRRTYIRTIRFKVRDDLLNTEIGQIFNAWSEIEYKTYKSMSKDTDWCSLIRQKINNLYTSYFDKEVVLNNDYMSLLNKPKDLYYKWLYGEDIDAVELTNTIDNAINKANTLKTMYQKQKMDLSWNEYKNIIEVFLQKIFNNCKLLVDYEKEISEPNITLHSFVEDNFYIKYICRSLEGEMLKYQKKYYNVKDHKKYKRCKECGKLIEKTNNRVMYCRDCYKKINGADAKNRMARYREKNKNKCVTF